MPCCPHPFHLPNWPDHFTRLLSGPPSTWATWPPRGLLGHQMKDPRISIHLNCGLLPLFSKCEQISVNLRKHNSSHRALFHNYFYFLCVFLLFAHLKEIKIRQQNDWKILKKIASLVSNLFPAYSEQLIEKLHYPYGVQLIIDHSVRQRYKLVLQTIRDPWKLLGTCYITPPSHGPVVLNLFLSNHHKEPGHN